MSGERTIYDIDDVLRPCTFRLVELYGAEVGIDFEHPAIMINGFLHGTFELMKRASPDEDPERIIDIVESILVKPEFHDVEPIEGAVEAVERSSERGINYAVSSSPICSKRETEEWIAGHFPGKFNGVYILGKRWGHGNKTDKLEKLQQLQATKFYDDLVRHVIRAAEAGIDSTLFGDYPWNSVDVLPANARKCASWSEARESFDERD
jgi:hypothetical protein